MDFNYNFKNLQKFIEDVKFLVQSGGGGTDLSVLTGGTGTNALILFFTILVTLWKLVILILVITLVVRYVYSVLVKGYNRTLYNIVTGSFYNKIDVDSLLQENDLLFEHFDKLCILVDAKCNPYDITSSLYKFPCKTSIGLKCQSVRKMIDDYYTSFEFKSVHHTASSYKVLNNKFIREKHYKLFSEYFLFYKPLLLYRPYDDVNNTCHSTSIGSTYDDKLKNNNVNIQNNNKNNTFNSSCQKILDLSTIHYQPKGENKIKDFTIEGNTFYNTYIRYLEKIGAMNTTNPNSPGKLSEEAKRYDLYMYEKQRYISGQKKLLEERYDVHYFLNNISNEINELLKVIGKNPYHHYLYSPQDRNIINKVTQNILKYKTFILNGSIYKELKYSDIHEYSWYMIEVFNFQRMLKSVTEIKEIWDNIIRTFKTYTSYNTNLLITYLNLSNSKRSIMFSKLMSHFNKDEIENILKYPIASRIFYSSFYIPDKEIKNETTYMTQYKLNMYIDCIQLYRKFMSSCEEVKLSPSNIEQLLNNLNQYSNNYKSFLASLHIMHLYLNIYRSDLCKMYSLRYLGTEDFFKELATPYIDDFINYKIKSYWQKIDLGDNNYVNKQLLPTFDKVWKRIGSFIENMLDTVWNQFGNKDDKPEQPKPPEEEQSFQKNEMQEEEAKANEESPSLPGQEDIKKDMASEKEDNSNEIQ